MKNIMKYLMAAWCVSSAVAAYGWGQKGHDVVAYIAECHLTPEAKATAETLLGGKSIVYYANWLDNASHTPDYAYTKTWHYKNIDRDENWYTARLEEKGDIVTALEKEMKILGDETQNMEDRALALKIVVHLMGDIHQPMHMGHRSDLGGNKWPVKFFGKTNKLHSVWDSSILEAGHKWSYTEWQYQIDRTDAEEEAKITESLAPSVWAKETYQYAGEIYEKTPQESNISYDEIAGWTPLIEQQLLRGGLRLAKVLNTLLDKNFGK